MTIPVCCQPSVNAAALRAEKSKVSRLTLYRQLFGWRGMWLAVRTKLSSSPFEATTTPPGSHHQVTLRLKTSDLATFQKVFLEHEYALPLGRHPRVILDAGANVGFASIYFATLYPDAKILAMEPEESNFKLLKQNVAPYPNVVPIRAALWSSSGLIDLVDPGLGHWGFRASEPSAGASEPTIAKVHARTVEDVMAEYGCDSIDVMKLDIEGGEREVLANPSPWIESVGVLVAELHDRYQVGCSRSFYLATQGFDFEIHKGENVFMLRRDFATALWQ